MRTPSRLEAKRRIGEARRARTLYVAAISLHEIAYAYHRKRLNLEGGLRRWFEIALTGRSPQVLPITTEIAMVSASLPDDFHGDPGDRLIAANAIMHELTICTHDRALLRFGGDGRYGVLAI